MSLNAGLEVSASGLPWAVDKRDFAASDLSKILLLDGEALDAEGAAKPPVAEGPVTLVGVAEVVDVKKFGSCANAKDCASRATKLNTNESKKRIDISY